MSPRRLNIDPLLLLRLEVEIIVGGLRLPSLCHGQRTSPLRQHWQGDTGEDEAGENSNGEDIFLDSVMSRGISQAKNDMLDLVVHSSADLEGARLRIRGEVV